MKKPQSKKASKKPSELLTPSRDPEEALLELLGEKQRAYHLDNNRFKVARCGRRAGKTYVVAGGHAVTNLKYPGDTTVYFGLTLDAAKEAIWDTMLELLIKLGIPHTYSEAKLEIYYANGARFKLLGADMQNIKKRLRGRKFRKVSVDECAFYTSVDDLILKVLLPTLADFAGPLEMTSSPGELPQGLFYEADQGDRTSQWSRHHWTMRDNPHFQQPAINPKYPNRAEEELDTICQLQFKGDWQHPTFVREYLGEWVFNARTRTYPLSAEQVVNKFNRLRREQYAIGVNLSQVAQQSAVVLRYGEYDREAQVIEAYTFKAEDLNELAAELSELLDSYDSLAIHCYIGDLEPEAIANFKQRFKLPLVISRYEKTAYHQRVIATDMRSGYIYVDQDCKEIIDEFNKIVKNEEGQELPNQNTLLADAFFAVYTSVYNTHLKTAAPPETEEQRIERELLEAVRSELEDHPDVYGYGYKYS